MKPINLFLIFITLFIFSSSFGQTLRIKIGNFKSGDTLTLAQFESLDSFVVNNKDYIVVGYSCIVLPLKGQALAVSCAGNKFGKVIVSILSKFKPGGRIVIDAIVRNAKGEKKKASQFILILR